MLCDTVAAAAAAKAKAKAKAKASINIRTTIASRIIRNKTNNNSKQT